MLNELRVIERGLEDSGIQVALMHPDVRAARRIPTLVVNLGDDGGVVGVLPLHPNVTAWTMRDGQHNSFPFVQPKLPLWNCPDDGTIGVFSDGKATPHDRRESLFKLQRGVTMNRREYNQWPGSKLKKRLRERLAQLRPLEGTKAEVVPATLERFIYAVDAKPESSGYALLRDIADELVKTLHKTSDNELLMVASALLIGRQDPRKDTRVCGSALLFQAAGFAKAIYEPSIDTAVSGALRKSESVGEEPEKRGTCALTGKVSSLLVGNSHQPNLPVVGPTWLYSKNKDIPANDRYGRFASEAMPIGRETMDRLDAGLRELTSAKRKGQTWCPVAAEVGNQNDLLVAFVPAAVQESFADFLSEDDYSQEDTTEENKHADAVARFEERAERIVAAAQGRIGGDFSNTPAQIVVLRKLDRANRKVVYAGALTIGDLRAGAQDWVCGERNIPGWLRLPIVDSRTKQVRVASPPHIAPLGLVRFSRQVFLNGGKERSEIRGMQAAETLALFMVHRENHRGHERRAARILRLTLARRQCLLAGVVHMNRRTTGRPHDHTAELLRTITVLGLILHKLGRRKGVYMSDTGFRLGQLLAAADAVHAGYCADVRKGAVPPSLLGNQVFGMAQVAPRKALAALCRRWKPYAAWAKKVGGERGRVDGLIGSELKSDQQRGWQMRKALRHARQMEPLADELSRSLADCRPSDTYLAELLLGYVAGLPTKEKATEGHETHGSVYGGEE